MTITWYFTDPDTPFLPLATPFRSRNWDANNGVSWELGEVEGQPRPWRNGSRVGVAVPIPGVFVGTAGQWMNGVGPQPWPPVPLGLDGTPQACFSCSLPGREYDCAFGPAFL